MAEKETKTNKIEREYIIPLRREFLKVPIYRRTQKAVKAIKEFIAKHMKVVDRDLSKVKLDVYLNNDIWFKGKTNPPSRVKVKATKEDDIVKVTFVEIPQHVKFLKARHEKRSKPAEAPVVAPAEEKKEEKTEEQKKDEAEKGKAVEIQHAKQAEQAAKAQKHTSKVKETKIQRMALKK